MQVFTRLDEQRPSRVFVPSPPPALVKLATSSIEAPHRQPLKWPVLKKGAVEVSAQATKKGYRTRNLAPGHAVPKGTSLEFSARTNVAEPYDVHWQVTNTGDEARRAGNLRGRFHQGRTWHEGAQYQGTHAIECFIVKDGLRVARSGDFRPSGARGDVRA